jgi:hypothetical protein
VYLAAGNDQDQPAKTTGPAMDQRNFTGDYDTLLELVKTRVSVRNLRPDPIPDAPHR